MSETIRLIAKLDIKGPNLIKGLQFDGLRVLGHVEELATIYYQEGIDELYYQDAVASLYGRDSLYEVVQKTADKIFVPLTVGGGIRSLNDMYQLLRAGADKVAINTEAAKNPALIEEAAKEFGSQCIVSAIEAYRYDDGSYKLWVNYGKDPTKIDALEWAKRVEDLGVGEIILTSINNDGMGCGFDNDLIKQVSQNASVPIIACGGGGQKQDFSDAVKLGSADAVVTASCIHYFYCQQIFENMAKSKVKSLKMGSHVDEGNIDFLREGHGGLQEYMVSPCAISDIKAGMQEAGIKVRTL